jgi:D-glycero-beta-D-manno-heptose-7-phosphate kinase
MSSEKEKLLEIAKKFGNRKVAVIGDILLDNYIYGKVSRVNPERPGYPLLTVEREENRLGGAGNVAVNFASLGADVSLFGVIGKDKQGFVIKKICKKTKVKLFAINRKRTLLKQRWIESTHNDYFGRADFGESNIKKINEQDSKMLFNEVVKEKPDVLILSDYNKGIFKGDLGSRIINWAKMHDVKVIVAPKPQNINSFHGASLVIPNLKETREIVGMEYADKEMHDIMRRLGEITECKNLIVTCGDDGIVTYDGEIGRMRTRAREVVDVTGAGDTTLAALSLAVSSGASLQEAAHIANVAAGIVCGKSGTAAVKQNELTRELMRD